MRDGGRDGEGGARLTSSSTDLVFARTVRGPASRRMLALFPSSSRTSTRSLRTQPPMRASFSRRVMRTVGSRRARWKAALRPVRPPPRMTTCGGGGGEAMGVGATVAGSSSGGGGWRWEKGGGAGAARPCAWGHVSAFAGSASHAQKWGEMRGCCSRARRLSARTMRAGSEGGTEERGRGCGGRRGEPNQSGKRTRRTRST